METIILLYPSDGVYNEVMDPILPLGLLSIAAPLVKEGYDVKIIDQRIDKDWKNTLITFLKRDPIFVAMTTMTGSQINFALEASKIVKENSSAYVIWGGNHPTFFPEQTLKNKYIDIIAIKEGEDTILELAIALKNNKSIEGVKGIGFKKEGKIILTEERGFTDLNNRPELPYHIVDMEKYFHRSFKEKRVLAVETSRGCPFPCTFCYINKSRWRSMEPEKVINNLKKLIQTFGIRSFHFLDDNFFTDPNRAKEILNMIIKENLNITFGFQGIRIDTLARMSHEDLSLLEKAGCKFLQPGVESGSDRVLRLIKKLITREQVINANKKLSHYNILVLYNFICGFPTETKEDLFQTTSLMYRIVKDNKNAMVGPVYIYTPYPGTPLYDLAVSQGFKEPKSLEEWANFDWTKIKEFNQTKEMLELFKRVTIASICIDDKIDTLSGSPLYKIAAKIYKPIARFRIKHDFYRFMPETYLLKNKIN